MDATGGPSHLSMLLAVFPLANVFSPIGPCVRALMMVESGGVAYGKGEE